VHGTIIYIFILTHKNLLHVQNKQSKPTHHDNNTQKMNLMWFTPTRLCPTMDGFLYYSFIFNPHNRCTLCSNKIHQFYPKFPSHSCIQCTLSSFYHLTIIISLTHTYHFISSPKLQATNHHIISFLLSNLFYPQNPLHIYTLILWLIPLQNGPKGLTTSN
jgi:hypothetical protein